jgi:type VI secretion system protein ImpL
LIAALGLIGAPIAVELLWACLVLLFICLVLLVIFLIRQARKAATPKPAAPPAGSYEAAKQENAGVNLIEAELPQSFSGALSTLRSRTADPDYRYTIPWFLMLGSSGAGKSSLISDSPLANLVEEQVRLEQSTAFTWNFFERGLVIDVGGWAFSPAASSVAAWRRLLHLFLNNRPARPLDGIVLVISCADLIGPHALSPAALVERGALIQNRFRQISQITSFQLPLYVILSQCDAVPGFREFTAELNDEELQQIFGWSRPGEDSAAFHPECVDEALDSIRISLERKQGELYAAHEPNSSRGDMFLFPGEIYGLAPNLRLLLGRAMHGSVQIPPPLLRGIYCCGAAAGHVDQTSSLAPLVPVSVPSAARLRALTPAMRDSFSWAPNQLGPWLQSDLQIAFVQDLFYKKIFVEKGLAMPLARHFMHRDRIRVSLQIATAAVALILTVFTAVAYHRLSGEEDNLVQLLGTIESDLTVAPSAGRKTSAETLIRAMADFDSRRFHSFFMPASWFTNVNQAIEKAMVPAFEVLVLQRFEHQLQDRFHRIATFPVRPYTETEDANSTRFEERPLEDLPQYVDMKSFLDELQKFQHFAGIYNQLSHKSADAPVASIVALDGYLQGHAYEAPLNDISNPYFAEAVGEATWKSFDYDSAHRSRISRTASELSDALYTTWIEHNPVEKVTRALTDHINTLAMPSSHPLDDLRKTHTAFADAVRVYSDPSLAWTGAETLTMPHNLAQVTVDAFADTNLFDPSLKPDTVALANEDFTRLAASVDHAETSLTGPVVKVDAGEIALSDKAQDMQMALDNLLGLSFMVESSSGSGMMEPPHNFTWNKASLEAAGALPASYQRYVAEDLGDAPVALRASFSRIALVQLERAVSRAIRDAMQPAPPIDSADRLTYLTQQTQDFSQVEGEISSLLALLQESSLNVPLTQLRRASITQASDLLLAFDRALDEEHPYAVPTAAISRWNIDGKPSAEVFDAATPDALEAYLSSQRATIESFSDSVTPLVVFLRTYRGSLSPRAARALTRWEGITSTVDHYKAKQPGTTLQVLETFISTGADKLVPGKICDTARPGSRSDYFAVIDAQLRHDLTLRCEALATEDFDRSYKLLANRFNRTLAGRFPFGPLDSSNVLEADPQLIAAVFSQRDAGGDLLANRPNSSPESHAFLSELDASRPWFASLLSTATAVQPPTLDFIPTFRVNRDQEIAGNQIIEWTLQVGAETFHASDPERKAHWNYGDTIRLTLRWAKDAPNMPAAAAGQAHPGYDLTVSGDTVSYTFKDPWSLIRMVQTFGIPNEKIGSSSTPDPFTLAFSIPELPASAGSAKLSTNPTQALVFIRITVFGPGEKQGIQNRNFPVTAASLE